MSAPFEKVHHVCIVVHDIDKSQAFYESVGIGPWIEYPPLAEYEELDVPNPEAFQELKYRVCNLGNVQLQLCQPSEKPSPQRAFLDAKGEGVFQLGFEVDDADAAQASVDLPVLMSGRRKNRTGFTYYDTLNEGGVNLLTRATFRAGT
ncbi:VOC family protein [Leucobacter sp. GX24907]